MSSVVNKKLLEIPPDVVAVERLVVVLLGVAELLSRGVTTILEEGVDGVLILAVDICLGKHIKVWHEPISRPDVFEDGVDFTRVRPRLLSKELVTGKP